METAIQPNPLMVTPFVSLLAAVALAPLWFAGWWGRHFLKVIAGLMAVTIAYYVAGMHAPERVLRTAAEYVSFICLVGSLFVVAGGIHIRVKGEATPRANVLFLLIGAVVANLLGTTGASMLLIRPWLRLNKYRLTAHHVVFFIFLISNVGGSLTPVGDPPLFLGYLQGVPFWWVAQQCWPIWLTGVGLLLAAFYAVDAWNFRRAPRLVRESETAHEQWRFQGLGNLFFLAVILAAVLVTHPAFLREALMVAAAAGSYFTTSKAVHAANDFNFAPIKEVAVLFAGIFATMMPALDWLQANAGGLGQPAPGLFYWGSGALSSVLDNAPTYLSFLSAAYGAFISPDTLGTITAHLRTHGADLSRAAGTPHAEQICQAVAVLQAHFPDALAHGTLTAAQTKTTWLLGNPLSVRCLQAISIGSVFFGANTYIGNGPNFMVKAIADQQKAHTPGFLGYIFRFTLPYMLPMLLVIWWLFFRR
ncbi:MAG TPA: sodium:proton antiporter [Candidatus Acidoferrum sp.]|nr:sodium:proton antiporter [Candidatus Acidoferrum sp.]